jgi:hypothetical protein
MQLPETVEVKGMKVLTTRQIAEAYGVSKDKIIYNFNYNKDRYVLGKHYIEVFGEELRRLKRTCEIQSSFKYAKTLYLWTEKGALLHAKSLNTDKAWEVYDYLVDFYFRAKEEPKETKPVPVDTVPVVSRQKDKKLPQIDNPIGVLKLLLQVAEDNGIGVSSYPFKTFESVLKNGNIGIRTGVTVEKACYELAWELSHAFIHYRNGDLIKSPLAKDYNDQATRSAELILKVLNVKMSQL